MDPPQFLLDALDDSITSGTFVDTKFYVFSRREPSGCIGSQRALYCNSRVLKTVPPQDYDALYKAGAEAIFPPGTVIADAAEELIHKLNARLGHSEAAE